MQQSNGDSGDYRARSKDGMNASRSSKMSKSHVKFGLEELPEKPY